MTIAQELTNLWCCASGSRCSAQDVVVWPQSPFHSTHGNIYNASQGCAKHFCWASSERADLRHTTLQELSVNHISGWHLLCWSPGVCHSIWFVGVLDTQGLPFDGFLFISRSVTRVQPFLLQRSFCLCPFCFTHMHLTWCSLAIDTRISINTSFLHYNCQCIQVIELTCCIYSRMISL